MGIMSRQEVAFLEKAREIGGCGSLRRDFCAGFMTRKLRMWGCDMVEKSISVVRRLLSECYFPNMFSKH